jgi:hypothetical protein
MASQQRRQDPKEAALAATRCLNPHPEQVTDVDGRRPASDRHDGGDLSRPFTVGGVGFAVARELGGEGARVALLAGCRRR